MRLGLSLGLGGSSLIGTVLPVFAVEEIGDEPVITSTGGAPTDTVSITIGSGPYAGTYTQDVRDSSTLTVGDIQAAPVPIVLPTFSGTEQVTNTLTGVAPLFIYEGADLGDITYQWVNNTDGTISGATDLDYTLQNADLGDTVKLQATYGGVSVDSANTGTIAGAYSIATDTTALAWYDPDTVTTSGGGTVLDAWPNSASGGSSDWDLDTVATGETAPAWDSVNKKATNSTGTQSLISGAMASSPFTVANLNANTYCLFAVADITGAGVALAMSDDSDANWIMALGVGEQFNPTTAIALLSGPFGGAAFGNGAFNFQTLNNSIVDQKHIWELRFNGTTANLYVDGRLEWTSAVSNTGNTTHNTITNVHMGLFAWGNASGVDSSRHGDGDFYEGLLLEDDTNADLARAELATRHSITLL